MLKVMTMNINYYGEGHGPWASREPLILEALREVRPDIVAFQAVRYEPGMNGGHDQASQIAHELPEYRFVIFQAAETDSEGRSNGSAILSRLPFAETGELHLSTLPGQDDQNQRILLRARFDSPDGPLHLFNAHFSWVDEQIQLNLDEALPYLRSFPGRALLVGDLNATPDNPAMQRLRRNGWIDAWALLRPGEEGHSFVENGRLAKRIDYAWLSAGLKDRAQDISLVAEKAVTGGIRASDHAGLVLTLNL